MKKKIIISTIALMLFAFSIATFAFTNHSNHNSGSCCAKDSCPIKGKDSCCNKADCCKDGKCQMNGECCKDEESCPMKKQDKTPDTSSVEVSKVTVVAEGEDCCNGGSCCKSGASCCHKKD